MVWRGGKYQRLETRPGVQHTEAYLEIWMSELRLGGLRMQSENTLCRHGFASIKGKRKPTLLQGEQSVVFGGGGGGTGVGTKNEGHLQGTGRVRPDGKKS